MSHALKMCPEASKLSAARYILTLAYQGAVSWYKRYGFQEIPTKEEDQDRQKMFLDLAVVRDAENRGHA